MKPSRNLSRAVDSAAPCRSAEVQGSRQSRHASLLPGLLLTIRQDETGRMSLPYLDGRLDLLMGLEPAELAQDISPFFSLFPQEDAARLLCELRRSSREMTTCHVEMALATAATFHTRFELSAIPVRLEHGVVEWDGFLRELAPRCVPLGEACAPSEHCLAQALEFAQGVINAIPDILFEVDRQGTYLNCWSSSPDMLAEQKALLIGKTVHQVLDPEGAEAAMAGIAEADEKGTAFGRMLHIVQPDGSSRWYEHSLAKKRGTNGGEDTFIALSRDVTSRVLAERALSDTYQHLRSVLHTIPDLVWLKDERGVYLACNHAFERFFGATEAEIVGKTDYDFVDREQANHFRLYDAIATEAGKICINEEWITYACDGSRGLLETRKLPVYGKAGKMIGVLGVAQDITDRKRMEQTLAAREREFRTLVENTPDTIARFGPDLRRRFVNPALAAFLGKEAAELLGKKTSEIPGGESGRLAEEKLIEVFKTGRAIEFEYAGHDRENNEVRILMRMAPEYNQEGGVESVLAVGRDITELSAFRQKIHQMAFYDTLTGLPNRALFNDRLRQMIADAAWHHHTAGLMMLDMDRFKAVNDTMGHVVGDQLLKEAARRLSECVRTYDTVARLGGDEFAILLPEIRAGEDLGRIAQNILNKFDEPFLLEGEEVFVSCSIGIALYPDDSLDEHDLLKFADAAMYFAKRSGRNSFRYYAKDLTATAQARLTLESDLRYAIQRGQIELHYQPKISLLDGAVVGSEALLRWRHPEQGMIPPNQFIPIAEDSGLILDVGKWVINDACRFAAATNEGIERPHKVAINLSARQFKGFNLVSTVQEALAKTGCRPEWIELEITESLLLDEDGQVLDMLRTFREMGISIAIDDFGTGYSALSYLARFPIDTLKIDRSFIGTVTADRYRAELVRAILSIARCLGQQVVAEGVETVEQAAFLAAHGCQVAQGFLFSKAVTEGDFSSLPQQFGNAAWSRN